MRNDNEPLCIVRDNLRPIPFREGGEDTPIFSIPELIEVLRNFTAQKPRMLIVGNRKSPQLFIGLAGEWAGVCAYPDPHGHLSWSATPAVPYSSEDLWVTSEGEPSRVRATCVMPVEDVIEIVAYVVEHGDLPDTIAWINSKDERLR